MSFDPTLIPVTFRYAQNLYDEIYKHSKLLLPEEMLEFGYPQSDKDLVRVYFGFLQQLARNIGLNSSQQYGATYSLKSMKCITQVRLGSKYNPAVYILNYRPTDELIIKYREASGKTNAFINPRKEELIARDIAELRIRVQRLEERLEGLKDVGHDIRRGSSLS